MSPGTRYGAIVRRISPGSWIDMLWPVSLLLTMFQNWTRFYEPILCGSTSSQNCCQGSRSLLMIWRYNGEIGGMTATLSGVVGRNAYIYVSLGYLFRRRALLTCCVRFLKGGVHPSGAMLGRCPIDQVFIIIHVALLSLYLSLLEPQIDKLPHDLGVVFTASPYFELSLICRFATGH